MIGKKAGDFIGLVDGLVGLIKNHQTMLFLCKNVALAKSKNQP
jgi:hypothetical protein